MAFFITARIDDHVVSVSAETAAEAFAEAVDWHVKRLVGVTISNGLRSYSVAEFSEAMALSEVAGTISSSVGQEQSLAQTAPN